MLIVSGLFSTEILARIVVYYDDLFWNGTKLGHFYLQTIKKA